LHACRPSADSVRTAAAGREANRTGFPDLVRFWPLRSDAGSRYELVEVKAPGDKLQDNQIRWLAYCTEQGIPVRVCHVQWRDEGSTP
jgi:hypothetical protein